MSEYLGLPDSRSQNASAVDALQEAREMPPGPQRTDALKKSWPASAFGVGHSSRPLRGNFFVQLRSFPPPFGPRLPPDA
jgi:hypothetical protein